MTSDFSNALFNPVNNHKAADLRDSSSSSNPG